MSVEEECNRISKIRKANYDLCTAINMTKLGMALDYCVSNKLMSGAKAKAFDTIASGLLKAMRLEIREEKK
jgi:hypothetical protein